MNSSRPLTAALSALGVLGLALTANGCGVAAGIAALIVSQDSGSSSSSVPAPVVLGVSSLQGSHGGGEVITVTGANFPPNVTASVGGVAAQVQYVNGGEIRVTLPAVAVVGPVDLVVTNPNGGSTVFTGLVYTNSTPTVTIPNLSGTLSQNIVIGFTLTDAESDPIDVVLQVDSGSGFQTIPASLILSGSLTGLASSPSGVMHTVTWNSGGTFSTQNAQNVRIRIQPIDTLDNQMGTEAVSNVFAVTNNTPVTLEIVQPASDAFNVAVNYRVQEQDGDAVSLVGIQYNDLTSGSVGAATLVSGQGVGAISLNAGPNLISSVWDSFTDLGPGNNKLVRLTVTISDGSSTVAATSAPFFVSNGPVSDQQAISMNTDVHGVIAAKVAGGDQRVDVVVTEAGLVGTGSSTARDSTGGKITILPNSGLGFDAPIEIFTTQAGFPRIAGVPGNETATNTFFNNTLAPSEVVAADFDEDGDTDLIVANSPHASFTTSDAGLFGNTTSGGGLSLILSNAGADVGNGLANVVRHQVTAHIEGGTTQPNFTGAGLTYQSAQAPRTTGRAPTFDPGTGVPSIPSAPPFGADNIGWLIQDLEEVELDATVNPDGGDLVILHAFAQLQTPMATSGANLGTGAVLVRKRLNPGNYTSPFYLDTTAMGQGPVQVAVADLTSIAHANVLGTALTGAGLNPPLTGRLNLNGGTTVAAGLPDIVTANALDMSLTFYIQTSASGTPDMTPGTYHGVKLPLAPLLGYLSGLPDNQIDNFPVVRGDTRGIAIGDLNGDNGLDFVVVSQLSQKMFVFVYDPFSAGPISLNFNASPQTLTMGTSTDNRAPYDTGSGTVLTPGVLPFRLSMIVDLPNIQCGRPTISDVDGDGRKDILVPMQLNNELLVYRNTGNVAASSAFGQSVTTPHFGVVPSGAVQVLTSAKPVRFTTSFQPFDLDVADFNGDRRDDLVVANGLSSDVSIFTQTAAGTLDQFFPIPLGGAPFQLTSGDLTGDGNPEVAVSFTNENQVQIFQPSGGTLNRVRTYDFSVAPFTSGVLTGAKPSGPFFMEIQDFNQDGTGDLLTAMQLLPSTLTSGVASVQTTTGAMIGITSNPLTDASGPAVSLFKAEPLQPIGFDVAIGDILDDGNGAPELVLGMNQATAIVVFRGLGNGSFDTANPIRITFSGTTGVNQVEIFDYNGDTRPDLVIGNSGGNSSLRIFYGNAGKNTMSVAGDFVNVPLVAGVGLPIGVAPRDLGGPNNRPDFVVSDFTSGTAAILFTNSAGSPLGGGAGTAPTFVNGGNPVSLTVGGSPGATSFGDLNNDGRVDFAIPWGGNNVVGVYLQNPNPTDTVNYTDLFFGPITLPTANSPIGSLILDVDGDGRQDLVVAARGASSLNVFLQR
ncbi:MAG: FG-GAP-like repeat-containing protein [Planctomycetota bacterium]